MQDKNVNKIRMVTTHKRGFSILTSGQEKTRIWWMRPRSGLSYWLERNPSMHLYELSINLGREVILQSFLCTIRTNITRCVPFCPSWLQYDPWGLNSPSLISSLYILEISTRCVVILSDFGKSVESRNVKPHLV